MRRTGLTRAPIVLVLPAAAYGGGEDTDAADAAEGAPSAVSEMPRDEPQNSDASYTRLDAEQRPSTEPEAPPRVLLGSVRVRMGIDGSCR